MSVRTESNVVLALAKFKSDYAWDKSLNVPVAHSTPSPKLDSAYGVDDHISTYLEDFTNGRK